MVSEKRKTGDIGEAIAKKYLKQKGFVILHQNYLKKWGEIDIVAEYKDILRFIEVKTTQYSVTRENNNKKVSRETYRPEENVTREKIERMHRTIQSYLNEFSRGTQEWQIDVIAVDLDLKTKQARVRFIENVTFG